MGTAEHPRSVFAHQLSLSSSFDESLYQHTNRGVFDSIRAFVFSLYLSSSSSEGDDLLSARGMQNITRERVAEHMQLSIHEEKPHPTMPAITVGGIGGPHLNFVELVTRVLQETGGVLRETGYPNLGTFIARALVDAERAGRSSGATSPDPDVVVQHLVRAFPSFQDSYSVQNQRRWFYILGHLNQDDLIVCAGPFSRIFV